MNKLYETLQEIYELEGESPAIPSEFIPLTLIFELDLTAWERVKLAFMLLTFRRLYTFNVAEVNNIGTRNAASYIISKSEADRIIEDTEDEDCL